MINNWLSDKLSRKIKPVAPRLNHFNNVVGLNIKQFYKKLGLNSDGFLKSPSTSRGPVCERYAQALG
jgi:hypothetical protein